MPRREFETYVSEPTLILMGCRAWDANRVKPGRCPVCGPGIKDGHDTAYCARCDSVSPAVQAKIDKARSLDRKREQARVEAENAKRDAIETLERAHQVELTESERRRIWLGNSKSGIHSKSSKVVNLAKVGRDWLTSIGQEPNWYLILDSLGNVVGEHDEPQNPEDLYDAESHPWG